MAAIFPKYIKVLEVKQSDFKSEVERICNIHIQELYLIIIYRSVFVLMVRFQGGLII